jgi:HEAT repeat protein
MRSLLLLLVLPLPGWADDPKVPPALLDSLASKEPAERIKAIRGLSKLGVPAVDHLVKALRDEDGQVRQSAAYALRILKAEPAALVKALQKHVKDKDPVVRAGVAGGLGRAESVAALAPLLADPDARVRGQAVQSVQLIAARVPAQRAPALAALEKMLGDSSAEVRHGLTFALPRCGKEATAALLRLADDREAKVRAYAIAGLARLPADEKATLAVLAKKAKDDPDRTVRQSALRGLARLGPAAQGAILAALDDREPAVQATALQMLPAVKVEAKKAVPRLRALAEKAENEQVREAAVLALGRLGGPEAEAAIGKVLACDNSLTRKACLQHLARKKSATKEHVPALIKALADPDADVRALAVHVLGSLGGDARSALPAVEKLQKDDDERVRKLAARAVEQIKGKKE